MRIGDYSFQYASRVEDGFYIPKYGSTNDGLVARHDYPIDVWNSPEVYDRAGIRGYEPMTAKELDTDEKKEEAFGNEENFIEEKFDGTRGVLHFFNDHARVFSRRISKKTGFYVENSDSVPQLKLTCCPELDGTVIDGEMFIDGRPFKDVSSTLNCLWDRAIERQIEKGFITFHAFDIIKYKGVDLRRMKLSERKDYLKRVIDLADNPYIVMVPYFSCGLVLSYPKGSAVSHEGNVVGYKDLEEREFNIKPGVFPALDNVLIFGDDEFYEMTPQAYYEWIVASGGEGVIIKPKDGQYHHKRGWEYSKIKKFLTRELILVSFDDPTMEYTGKFPDDSWDYWAKDGEAVYEKGFGKKFSAKALIDEGYTPVTRHWYNGQVGNLILGVLIPVQDYHNIPTNKQGKIWSMPDVPGGYYCMEVCECSGFDDDTRAYFTDNEDSLIGSVIEVRANEIMRDSGRLRHPRYMRMREDKNAEECKWESHIG